MPRIPRRGILALAAASTCPGVRAAATRDADEPRAFYVIGDTHYFADAASPDRLLPASAAMTTGLVDTLNRLVGSEIAPPAGGGTVRRPCGVIHAGDIIDTGDKQGADAVRMQRTEIAAFERAMGLDGGDAGPAPREYDVFNCDNASLFGGPAQAFFYVEIGPEGLVVREYATRDGWRSGAWTPLVWRRARQAVAAG